AIALYLAEQFPDAKLAPAPGSPERGRYLSLMVYATSQLEPAMGDALMGIETGSYRGWTDFDHAEKLIVAELGDGPWLFGDWFTAADVMIGAMFAWKRMFKPDSPEHPAITAYVNRLQARPHGLKLG
ncbi:MAG: glutathione S-transferase family protein, partial [Candidatus Melainabacteria bacterium HGW-Melainabacteria-1]